MTPEIWHRIGRYTLYTLIFFGLATIGVFSWAKEWYWVAGIGGCFAVILIDEAVSFIIKKKSISSQYGDFIKRDPVKAYMGLGFFSLAMISLVLHLVAYGLRDKKND